MVYFKIVRFCVFLLKIFMFSEFYTIAFIKNKKAVCPFEEGRKVKAILHGKEMKLLFSVGHIHTHSSL